MMIYGSVFLMSRAWKGMVKPKTEPPSTEGLALFLSPTQLDYFLNLAIPIPSQQITSLQQFAWLLTHPTSQGQLPFSTDLQRAYLKQALLQTGLYLLAR